MEDWLYNDGTEHRPIARYILACQSTREIVHTKDFALWQQAVTKIPRGTKVGSYDTCSVPRSYGLPDAVIHQFEQAFSDAGLQVETDLREVCYCAGPR